MSNQARPQPRIMPSQAPQPLSQAPQPLSQQPVPISQPKQPQAPADRPIVDRPPRQAANLTVQVRRFRYISFFQADANLIDIAPGGVKLAFTYDVRARPGDRFWVFIPSLTAGADARSTFVCRAVCRWFDAAHQIVGASFERPSPDAVRNLMALIDALNKRGKVG